MIKFIIEGQSLEHPLEDDCWDRVAKGVLGDDGFVSWEEFVDEDQRAVFAPYVFALRNNDSVRWALGTMGYQARVTERTP